jgi:hypothetical protein
MPSTDSMLLLLMRLLRKDSRIAELANIAGPDGTICPKH